MGSSGRYNGSIGIRWFVSWLILVLLGFGSGAAEAVTLVRGPYLQTPTEASIIVRWRTDLTVDTRLAYGQSFDQLDTVISDVQWVNDHEVLIEGLTAATRYYYSIGTSTEVFAGGDPDHWFETAPAGNDRLATQIWVLGDSGTADANSAAVRDGYLISSAGVPSDVWLMLGDNAYFSGTDEEYQAAVFDTYPMVLRHTPLWSTFGNHDALSSDSPTQMGPYYEVFSFPGSGQAGGIASGTEAYYSFDHGNIHFICLDSSDTSLALDGSMMLWLVADLQATTRDWIVAFFHHPPYTKGSHDSDTEARLIEVRENVIPVLENHGVDLVFSGHSHHYERSFLLDGHYGFSDSFDPGSMLLDGGDGRIDGDGPYVKEPGLHRGTVYVVNGTGGNVGGADAGLDHPAMFTSHAVLGSVILEVEGDTLDARFIDTTGAPLDWFTLIKEGLPIFRDGFEYGDTGAWSGVLR